MKHLLDNFGGEGRGLVMLQPNTCPTPRRKEHGWFLFSLLINSGAEERELGPEEVVQHAGANSKGFGRRVGEGVQGG